MKYLVSIFCLFAVALVADANPPQVRRVVVQQACPVQVQQSYAVQSYAVQSYAVPVQVQSYAVQPVQVQQYVQPVRVQSFAVQQSVLRVNQPQILQQNTIIRRGLFGLRAKRIRSTTIIR